MPPPSSTPLNSESININETPAITTQALLVSLEELRMSLSARVEELGRSVERLRLEAAELGRNLDGDRINTNQLNMTPPIPINTNPQIGNSPASNENNRPRPGSSPSSPPFRLPRPLPHFVSGPLPPGMTATTPPSNRSASPILTQPSLISTSTIPPPRGTGTPSFVRATHPASSAIATELQSLSRPITTTEIGALLDRASQSTAIISSMRGSLLPIDNTTSTEPLDVRYAEIVNALHRLDMDARALSESAEARSSESSIDMWNSQLIQLAQSLRRQHMAFQRWVTDVSRSHLDRSGEISGIEVSRNLTRRSILAAAEAVQSHGDIPPAIGRRFLDALRGTEPVHTPSSGTDQNQSQNTGPPRTPPRLRGCPPTNSHEVRHQPDPIVVRSISASPDSTIRASSRRTSPSLVSGQLSDASHADATTTVGGLLTRSINQENDPARNDLDIDGTRFGAMVAGTSTAARHRPRLDPNSALTSRGMSVEQRIRISNHQAELRRQHREATQTQRSGTDDVVTVARREQREQARSLRSLAREIVNSQNHVSPPASAPAPAPGSIRNSEARPQTQVVVEIGVTTFSQPMRGLPSNPDETSSNPRVISPPGGQSAEIRRFQPARGVRDATTPQNLTGNRTIEPLRDNRRYQPGALQASAASAEQDDRTQRANEARRLPSSRSLESELAALARARREIARLAQAGISNSAIDSRSDALNRDQPDPVPGVGDQGSRRWQGLRASLRRRLEPITASVEEVSGEPTPSSPTVIREGGSSANVIFENDMLIFQPEEDNSRPSQARQSQTANAEVRAGVQNEVDAGIGYRHLRGTDRANRPWTNLSPRPARNAREEDSWLEMYLETLLHAWPQASVQRREELLFEARRYIRTMTTQQVLAPNANNAFIQQRSRLEQPDTPPGVNEGLVAPRNGQSTETLADRGRYSSGQGDSLEPRQYPPDRNDNILRDPRGQSGWSDFLLNQAAPVDTWTNSDSSEDESEGRQSEEEDEDDSDESESESDGDGPDDADHTARHNSDLLRVSVDLLRALQGLSGPSPRDHAVGRRNREAIEDDEDHEDSAVRLESNGQMNSGAMPAGDRGERREIRDELRGDGAPARKEDLPFDIAGTLSEGIRGMKGEGVGENPDMGRRVYRSLIDI